MIARGLIFSEIPDVVGKYPKSLTFFNTIFIFNITGKFMNIRLGLVDLHLSFTAWISLSMLGTFSLALVKLAIGPLKISAISSCTVANSPSAWTVVIRKPCSSIKHKCAKRIWKWIFLSMWESDFYQWSQSCVSIWERRVSCSQTISTVRNIYLWCF